MKNHSGNQNFSHFSRFSLKNLESNYDSMTVITIIKGCIIPNCHQREWKIEWRKSYGNQISQSKSIVQYTFPHYTKVLVREEIKLYTVSDFWADVGGYLGLLLGESVVSYVLLGTHWMKKIFFN